MTEYHTQTVEIRIDKSSRAYRRLEKIAERDGVSVDIVINTLLILDGGKFIGGLIKRLEK